jgi:acyl transferase domain-containing protein
LLVGEVDAITEVPSSRFSLDAVYDPRPQTPGRVSTRYGAFLDGIDLFDAEFFGMTPLEAKNVDPQQRLLLEIAWEALEDAGMSLDRIPRRRTGVYVGMMASDYEDRMQSDTTTLNGFALNGGGRYGASGRLSFCLGLNGPSLTVDTACSSSLLAVHLASQALRQRECDLAFAGGAHVVLQPHVSISLSQANILAKDGHCKFGDASADGFVRGEGAGLVVLKRLEDAIADGDRIHAVLRGSGVNNDGHATRTMGKPSRQKQEDLLREVYRTCGVDPKEVDYVEAHGTGTSAGDPIELAAIGNVLGAAHTREKPLRVGSVKTNIGHTEGASGIAGFIKLALCLSHRRVPRSLHFRDPSPAVAWDELHLEMQASTTAWLGEPFTRKGGVNSFGMSGTNVHAVLEEAPSAQQMPTGVVDSRAAPRTRHVLPLSAKTDAALREMARRYAIHLAEHPELSIEDVCHSAGVARAHLTKRVALIVGSRDEARAKLEAVASGGPGTRNEPSTRAAGERRVAFLFSGQGSQYVGMGRRLYAESLAFRAALDECARALDPWLAVPLVSMLYASDSDALLRDTANAQPALFALQYALVSLWRSWGVVPDAVLGHSVGELAALCVAGVLSLADAARLVAERGRRMQALPTGAMASVMASASRVTAAIGPVDGRLSIAAINGPELVTVSGEPEAIAGLCAKLALAGIRTKRLDVSHAFHSAMMDPMLDGFERVVGEVTLSRPTLPVVSSLHGAVIAADALTPAYLRQEIREPVQFSEGIRALHELGMDTFVEIGPQPTLITMAMTSFPSATRCTWLPSLRKGRDDWQVILETLVRLYERGVEVDWAGVGEPSGPGRVPLPLYAWQRRRHWIDAAKVARHPAAEPDLADEPIATNEAASEADEAPGYASGTMRVARVARSSGDSLLSIRELLPVSPETSEDASLESIGVDSLGLAILRSALTDLPGGRELARRLSPGSLASDVLHFIDSIEPEAVVPTHDLEGYVAAADDAWVPVTPASVNKRSEEHVLLSRGARIDSPEGEVVLGEMRMNTSHPFFYERTLDHVPGLYLIEAVRQLFNWRLFAKDGALAQGGTLDRVEADFFQFIEHEEVVHIVLRSDGDAYTADLFQSGARKARITMAARRIDSAEYGLLRSEQRRRSAR